MRPGAVLPVLIAQVCAFGCLEPTPDGRVFLLSNATPVTIRNDTRLASGPAGAILFQREFGDASELPRVAVLPDEIGDADRVILHYRAWRRQGPDSDLAPAGHRSVEVPVNRSGARPRAPLVRLRGLARSLPVTLQVSVVPVTGSAAEVLRVPVVVPEGAVFELGYGLREESWSSGASPTRFGISVLDGEERITLFGPTLDPDEPRHRGWFHARFSLRRFVGREVELELSTSNAEIGKIPALPVWGDPVMNVPPPAPAPAPAPANLLLISIDTLRARSVGAYGYGRDTTPFLDEVAARSAVFENAITPSVTTGPAHMSLFTGLYPTRHGMRLGLEPVSGEAALLAERLAASGFLTAAFTEDGYLVRERGFGRGFRRYVENRGVAGHAPGEARLTFSRARRWLSRSASPPFLLFVHTYEVHSPYRPSPEYATLFEDDETPGPENPGMRRQRDNYDREIRVVDDELRRLFATLEKTGLDASTLVVIVSDHGEEFAEHGRYQHGGAVYEESLRVPLLFFAPDRIAPRRLDAPVSLIDVAPTVLDLLGLPVDPGFDGASLAGALLRDEAIAPRTLFAEARAESRWIAPWQSERWNPPLVAVRSPDAKYIVHRPLRGDAEPMVRFDLSRDAAERSPERVAGEEERRVQALVDGYLSGGRDPGGAEAPSLSPVLEDRLRKLGYVN